MLKITVAGRLGRDAQYKTTQGGAELCSFAVAADVGFGENKQTYWVDVTRWGKGAEGLSRHLLKGTSVTVTGDLSTREYEGKTYLQCRADEVALQGGRQGGERKQPYDDGGGADNWQNDPLDDDADSIPF